ncbi:MAG TPA: Hsp70 family protein [Anaerolineales bacterium]|nr:Hsp70 family protein [Anaerolineales bacterium]
MGVRVGIDFGTSNSGVAIYRDGRVQVLPIDGKNLVPEVVKTILYITQDFRHFIGQEAVELYYKQNINRQRRFVRKWAGEIDYRGSDMHYVRDIYVYVDELQPGRLLQFIKSALRSDKYQGTQIFDRYYNLSDIISAYLFELKQRAEALLAEEIEGVTLGRPVRFSKNEELDRKAQGTLQQAALEAGFKQVDFELEPVAAAIYYELTLSKPENVLIFDFGGGTLDLTIMRLGDPKQRTVYASGGIGIAGSDFDRAIIEKRMLYHFGKGQVQHDPEILKLVQAIPDWSGLPELSTPMAKAELERAILAGKAPVRLKALEALIFNDLAFSFYNMVESTKITLSSQGATVASLKEKYLDIWELYTRSQFEKDILEQSEQIERVLMETVAESGLEFGQIDAVVKTGGSSNIPLFSEMLGRVFGNTKVKASDIFNSVTAGLAIKAKRRS